MGVQFFKNLLFYVVEIIIIFVNFKLIVLYIKVFIYLSLNINFSIHSGVENIFL